MNVKEITRTTLNLVVFCAIVGFLLSFYNGLTSGPILENKRKEVVEVQKKLLDADEYKPMDDQGMPDAWKAVKGGKLIGYIVKTQASGYSASEKITVMFSVSPEFKVTGVNIVSQNETPGLGTNIEEDKSLKQFGDKPFVAQFDGKGANSLKIGSSPTPGKDYIAAITGATVSSKAVTVGVHDSLIKLEEAAKGGKKPGSALPVKTGHSGDRPLFGAPAEACDKCTKVPAAVQSKLKAKTHKTLIHGKIWQGLDASGKVTGYASVGQNSGFKGKLEVIIFTDAGFKITSVDLYRHSEDSVYLKKIADAGFYRQYVGKKNMMEINFNEHKKGGIDAVTGATVTCSGINGGVLDALDRLLLNCKSK